MFPKVISSPHNQWAGGITNQLKFVLKVLSPIISMARRDCQKSKPP